MLTRLLVDGDVDTKSLLLAAVRRNGEEEYKIVAGANHIGMLQNCVLKACPGIEIASLIVLKVDKEMKITKTGDQKWHFEDV